MHILQLVPFSPIVLISFALAWIYLWSATFVLAETGGGVFVKHKLSKIITVIFSGISKAISKFRYTSFLAADASDPLIVDKYRNRVAITQIILSILAIVLGLLALFYSYYLVFIFHNLPMICPDANPETKAKTWIWLASNFTATNLHSWWFLKFTVMCLAHALNLEIPDYVAIDNLDTHAHAKCTLCLIKALFIEKKSFGFIAGTTLGGFVYVFILILATFGLIKAYKHLSNQRDIKQLQSSTGDGRLHRVKLILNTLLYLLRWGTVIYSYLVKPIQIFYFISLLIRWNPWDVVGVFSKIVELWVVYLGGYISLEWLEGLWFLLSRLYPSISGVEDKHLYVGVMFSLLAALLVGLDCVMGDGLYVYVASICKYIDAKSTYFTWPVLVAIEKKIKSIANYINKNGAWVSFFYRLFITGWIIYSTYSYIRAALDKIDPAFPTSLMFTLVSVNFLIAYAIIIIVYIWIKRFFK